MTQHQQKATPSSHAVAVVSREFPVRILNCSPSGCLVETSTHIDIGTVGSISLVMGDQECVDDVEVVRCQPIKGAGAVYHVAVRFLGAASVRSRSIGLWQALARSGDRSASRARE